MPPLNKLKSGAFTKYLIGNKLSLTIVKETEDFFVQQLDLSSKIWRNWTKTAAFGGF